VINGAQWTVVFPEGAQIYDGKSDQFVERKLGTTESNESKTTAHLFLRGNAQTPYDFQKHQWDSQRYDTGDGNISFGHTFDGERNLSGSVRLDYGTLETNGIRDLQYKVEYLGAQNDALRDVRMEDKLKYQTLEEGIERPLLVQGAYARAATPGAEPKASLTATAGFRRGELVRDFITGPRQTVYNLSRKYIVPGSERVYVDGELLTNGTDYTVVNTAGQLAFLNPERIDDLSVISVEYEADLTPKKDLGSLSLLDMLPADNEVGTWARSGEATLITDESGLYTQIDGGAPKYIERGWVSSVYVKYVQGARNIQVAIHDMGSDSGAQAIYNFSLPAARMPIPGIDNAVVQMDLSAAYSAFAYLDRFYIELNIGSKDDASLSSIELFANQVVKRKSQAGANSGDQFKQWMMATRAATSPVQGMEIGARVAQLQNTSEVMRDPITNQPMVDPVSGMQKLAPTRGLLTGTADARYQHAIGQGGLITGYGEFAGSDRQDSGAPNGWAGMGFVRLSHSALEGMISGRKSSQGFTSMGSDSTRFGKLSDELRLSATGYPVAWLPTTVFFTRQNSWLDDGTGTGTITDRTGVIQHALARIQLNKKGLPMLSQQVGRTDLDNANFKTGRWQSVSQLDYDLAQIPGVTFIKRFNVRGLYSISQADTDPTGKASYTDRVQLSRLEGKFLPTNTESIYALFRSRLVERQNQGREDYARNLLHWEIYSGIQSAIIPGLVPKVNYTATFDDNRLPVASASTDTSTATGTGTGTGTGTPILAPPSLRASTSALVPPGPSPPVPGAGPVPPTRTVQATIGGALGIFPGQWWKLLAPAAIEPQFSVGDSETAIDQLKTQYNRTYRFDNRAVWAGGGKWDAELYQLYQVGVTQSDHHKNAEQLQIRNRFVYRPAFNSPITLRLNYQDTRGLNAEGVGTGWADQALYEIILEWLMRWNAGLTTRARFTFDRTDTSNYAAIDPDTGLAITYDNTQYKAGPEIELRFFPLQEAAALYLYQRDGFFRLFGHNDGATYGMTDGTSYYIAAGGIWRMGDKIYLDGGVQYDHLGCFTSACPNGTYFKSACSAVSRITPRLYLTVNL